MDSASATSTAPAVDKAKVTADQMRRRRMRRQLEANLAKRTRKLVTPEGAVLNLTLSTASERAGAFFIDLTIIVLGILIAAFAFSALMTAIGGNASQIIEAIAIVVIFLVRFFYFILFELSRKAATPGKMALGLRVADRHGGQLKANAIIARNFMRELEFFLPLQAMFGLMGSGDEVDGWINLLLFLWCSIFLLFPIFNREKLRIGDLIAGTMVLHAPKIELLPDITSAKPTEVFDEAATSGFVFTPAQLDIYGIHELQVLEGVLRQSSADIQKDVANKIALKIGWTPEKGQSIRGFLEAFYKALRKHLEQRLLFGDRKEDKFDRK